MELCYEIRYSNLMDFYYRDSIFNEEHLHSNIHHLYENYLLKNGHLEKVTQKSYIKLFQNLYTDTLLFQTRENFENEFNHNPNLLFTSPSAFIAKSGCIDYLFKHLKLIDDSNWRIKWLIKYNELEAEGFYDFKSPKSQKIIEELISIVPKKDFESITNRRHLLNLMYHYSTIKY